MGYLSTSTACFSATMRQDGWAQRRTTCSHRLAVAPPEEEIFALSIRYAAAAPGMRALKIACGWGGFAELAARDYGACGRRDYPLARPARICPGARRGPVAGQVDLLLDDSRDLRSSFDRIASIEMFEAVGEKYWPDFFASVPERLAPGGRAGLQIITIADRIFETYRRGADFIQRHVFPGGMLPSARAAAAGSGAGRARLVGRALVRRRLCRDAGALAGAVPGRLAAHRRRRAAAGAGRRMHRFKRLWEYYLAYCETGFRAGWTDVGQLVLVRPA